MKIVILFGPPGSGKGTQTEMLEKNLGLKHISTGEIFREEVKKRTPLGIEIEEGMKIGKFVSDEKTIEIIKKKLSEIKSDVILDGFPRNIKQAEFFLKIYKNIQVINLEVHAKELKDRLLLRAKNQGREDDKIEIIEQRIIQYERETKPILNLFEKNKITIFHINGIGKREDIQKNILEKLKSA